MPNFTVVVLYVLLVTTPKHTVPTSIIPSLDGPAIPVTEIATSLFDVYYNSTKFFEYPANTTSYAQVAHVYRYNDPSYHGNVTWTDILNNMRDPKGKTPGDLIADLVVERLTRDELDTWIRKFKLTNVTR